MGTLTLAALGAGRGERQTSFDIVFNLASVRLAITNRGSTMLERIYTLVTLVPPK